MGKGRENRKAGYYLTTFINGAVAESNYYN